MSMPSSTLPTEADSVTFFPLGGLGEIGMNCFALRQGEQILVVDCGATFPDDDVGVDLVVPDFRWLWEHGSKIVGIFITHGHEDHIGALPHFLRGLRHTPPVFAPAHASALIASRLSEQKMDSDCLHLVRPGERYEVGAFVVEPIAVAHSIVDATALCIETKVGRILHTADFDLDPEQPAGHLTNAARLSELGESGITLLLSDSTNIDVPERFHGEGDVYREIRRKIFEAPQRVVVGMFSSNVHRLKALIEAAEITGRKLCLLGRSLIRQVRICSDLGYLNYKSDLLVSPDDVGDLAPSETLIVAGGSQGEAPSSLRRLSLGTHSSLTLDAGDWVLLSSRVIPGHERAVHVMTGDFLRRGVQVISGREAPRIHTSGHASRSELAQMMVWTRPRSFIPVHGTLHHLRRHQALAQEMGIPASAVVENGTPVEIRSSGELRVLSPVASGAVRLIAGGEVLGVKSRRRRTDLARRGTLFLSVAIDEQGLKVGQAHITSQGVAGIDDDEDALQVLVSRVQEVLQRGRHPRTVDLKEALGRALRSVALEMCGAKPIISVHVHVVTPAV